ALSGDDGAEPRHRVLLALVHNLSRSKRRLRPSAGLRPAREGARLLSQVMAKIWKIVAAGLGVLAAEDAQQRRALLRSRAPIEQQHALALAFMGGSGAGASFRRNPQAGR